MHVVYIDFRLLHPKKPNINSLKKHNIVYVEITETALCGVNQCKKSTERNTNGPQICNVMEKIL